MSSFILSELKNQIVYARGTPTDRRNSPNIS
jgi:hypothetical protein